MQCHYDNQTYGVNESIITLDCSKRCECQNVNGSLASICTPLCKNMTNPNPKCDPKTEVIEEDQIRLNGTSCNCTKKKCVSGLKLVVKLHSETMSR